MLLDVLVAAFAVYLFLFVGKLPQLWKVVGASTDALMVSPGLPGRYNRTATFATGLVLSFFTLGRLLYTEGWAFFGPYTEDHLDVIRNHHRGEK